LHRRIQGLGKEDQTRYGNSEDLKIIEQWEAKNLREIEPAEDSKRYNSDVYELILDG
jgi:hypothetical protein